VEIQEGQHECNAQHDHVKTPGLHIRILWGARRPRLKLLIVAKMKDDALAFPFIL
jgi:hypothetical protein